LLITILTAINLSTLSTALEITEIESNPAGADSGNEWIEVYSESEISLSDYILENGDGGTYQIQETFSGYFIIKLEKQWLDNKDELVILKKDSEELERTQLISDSKNNEKTWSKCNGEWSFEESTKGIANNCNSNTENNQDPQSSDTNQQNNNDSNDNNQDPGDNTNQNTNQQPSSNGITQTNNNTIVANQFQNLNLQDQEKLVLNAPSREKQTPPTFSKEAKTRMWILYSFSAICIVLIIALAWNKL